MNARELFFHLIIKNAEIKSDKVKPLENKITKYISENMATRIKISKLHRRSVTLQLLH